MRVSQIVNKGISVDPLIHEEISSLDEVFVPREIPYGQDAIYVDMIVQTVLRDEKLRKLAARMCKKQTPGSGVDMIAAMERRMGKWLERLSFATIDPDTAMHHAMMTLIKNHQEELTTPKVSIQARQKPSMGSSITGKLKAFFSPSGNQATA